MSGLCLELILKMFSESYKPNQMLSGDTETSDLLFLTAPPIRGAS